MSRVNADLYPGLALFGLTFLGLFICAKLLDKANQHTTGRFHWFITRAFLIGYTKRGYYYLALWMLSAMTTGAIVFGSLHFLGVGPFRD